MYRARGARQTFRHAWQSGHSWTNHIFPPLVIVIVVGSVYYAVTRRTDLNGAGASSSGTSHAAVTHSEPTMVTKPVQPLATPTVQKLNGKVTFSVDTKKVTQVQKVEFYVSNRLIGASYNQPFTVSIDEATLQPGSHQVVAKVYTETTTASTPPADFTSDIQPGPAPASDNVIPTGPAVVSPLPPTPPQNTPPISQPVSVGVPTSVTASVIAGPVVALSWNAPSEGTATSYQIWRDGSQLTTTTDLFYIDTQVAVGESHDYYVVSVGDGVQSDASVSVHADILALPATGNGLPTNPPAIGKIPLHNLTWFELAATCCPLSAIRY